MVTLFLVFAASLQSHASSFVLDGGIIETNISEQIVECGSYQVLLRNEQFPYKYETNIPKKYDIKGFYGSSSIVNKSAFILPSGAKVPKPNEISELKNSYPIDRTYLPGSAVCKDNTLIVSYWSGGNCKECEAFIQFEISNGKPKNAQKVNYGDVEALKN